MALSWRLHPIWRGLAESCPDLRPGQAVSVYIKSILPEKMKIKLVIVNRSLGQNHRFDLQYFVTSGHIDRWVYSTPESKKQIVTEICLPGFESGLKNGAKPFILVQDGTRPAGPARPYHKRK